jgi:hypothetical protein
MIRSSLRGIERHVAALRHTAGLDVPSPEPETFFLAKEGQRAMLA